MPPRRHLGGQKDLPVRNRYALLVNASLALLAGCVSGDSANGASASQLAGDTAASGSGASSNLGLNGSMGQAASGEQHWLGTWTASPYFDAGNQPPASLSNSVRPPNTEAVVRGAEERVVPILMTAMAAGLALIPLALGGAKTGSEIQTPMAIVILCGLITSTLLNMIVVPTLYLKYAEPLPGRPVAEGDRS